MCDPQGEGDGDTKSLCDITNASESMQQDFISYFQKGKIIGEPETDGNTARIKFKFGPDGERDETMKLIKRGEKWYLLAF